jgi:predicted metal-binding protein
MQHVLNNAVNFLVAKIYTGCPGRNVPDFGKMFLKLKYTDITQNTYIQSWMFMEIMAREVWNYGSCYTLIDYQIPIKTGRNMWFL